MLEKSFSHLNRLATETFRGGWATHLWQGFRLLAVDGTTLRLPLGVALARAFGMQSSGPTLPRASVLYDIAHDLVAAIPTAASVVGRPRAGAGASDCPALRRSLELRSRLSRLLVLRAASGPRDRFLYAPLAQQLSRCPCVSGQRRGLLGRHPDRSAEQRRACRDQGLAAEPIPVRLDESYRRQKRWAEIENLSGRPVLAARRFAHRKWSYRVHGSLTSRR